MPGSPRRSRELLRLAAGLVLAVVTALVASEGARFVHLALVPHAPCEHGQLVHVHGHGGPGHRPPAPPLAAQDTHSRELAVEGSELSDDDHQHCDHLAVQQAPLPSVSMQVPPQVLAWMDLPASIGPGETVQAIALLQLAPKLSPPRG